LKVEEKNLVGKLDLSEYINLEELYCYHNMLTEINFANDSFSKVRVLHVGGNDFPEQDLSIFSKFSKLKVLNLGNNNFVGSLKPLKNLKELSSIDISDTNIN
jgi:Leucine-rich repeat (LRR) protein